MKENYCICGQLVANHIDRSEHILSHFEQKHCISCDNQLIFVAGKWYQPHIDINCNAIKEELIDDPDFGELLTDNVSDMQEVDTSSIELVEMPLPKEEFLEEIEENNELEHDENFSNLIDAELSDESTHLQSKSFLSSGSTNQKKVFQCQKCLRVYAHQSTLSKHKGVCKGIPAAPKSPILPCPLTSPKKVFKCKKCLRIYAHQPSLSKHKKICNGIPEAPRKLIPLESLASMKQTFECKKCFKIYAHQPSLCKHKKTCNGPVTTELPAKSANLQTFFECKICFQKFKHPSGVSVHRKTCEGVEQKWTNDVESNEVASLVGSSHSVVSNLMGNFIDQSLELSQSSLSQSDSTDQKTNASLTISNPNGLESSSIRSTDNPPRIKPFRCLICSARFLRRGDVKNHIKLIHEKTRKRPVRLYDATKTFFKKDESGRYKCPYCPKTFVHTSSANCHKRKAHRDHLSYGSVKCELCPATYQNRKSLLGHVQKKHTAPSPRIIIERRERRPTDVSEINQLIEYNGEARSEDKQLIVGNHFGLSNPTEIHADEMLQLTQTASFQSDTIQIRSESQTTNNNSSESPLNKLTDNFSECRPFKCLICSGRFMRRGDAQRHVRNVHKNTRRKEERLFEVEKKPILVDVLGRYQCPYCPRTFVHRSGAILHRRNNHQDRLCNGSIKCKLCPAAFQKNTSLRTHMSRVHGGINAVRFSCYVCQTSFRYPKMLTSHMQTHPNIEYKCSFSGCEERFNSDKMLRHHLSKHVETQCDACHKSYSQLHTHKCNQPDSKKFICDICGKIFTKKFSLKYHINTHTDSRPYSCNICNKPFHSSTALSRHRQIHSGIKRLKCSVELCERAFIQHTDLYRHQFKAHGIFRKKFPCTICDEIFPENSLLRKHIQNHEAV